MAELNPILQQIIDRDARVRAKRAADAANPPQNTAPPVLPAPNLPQHTTPYTYTGQPIVGNAAGGQPRGGVPGQGSFFTSLPEYLSQLPSPSQIYQGLQQYMQGGGNVPGTEYQSLFNRYQAKQRKEIEQQTQ